jgi:hypothetical protein
VSSIEPRASRISATTSSGEGQERGGERDRHGSRYIKRRSGALPSIERPLIAGVLPRRLRRNQELCENVRPCDNSARRCEFGIFQTSQRFLANIVDRALRMLA